MSVRFFLGVDGGGTHCRARLRDASGRLLGEATGGASNIFTDPDEAIANVDRVSRATFAQAGLDALQLAETAACFGLAGANMAGAASAAVRKNTA